MNERTNKTRFLYGVEINEKVCPHCGHLSYTRIKDLDYFLMREEKIK